MLKSELMAEDMTNGSSGSEAVPAARRRRNPRPPDLPELGRLPDGRLAAWTGEKFSAVRIKPCFPWMEGRRYFSLVDEKEREVALIEDPDELPPRERTLVEEALSETRFIFEVTAIVRIEDEFELRDWQVVTAQGPRRFQTKLDEWPQRLPAGGFLVRDVNGDMYRLPELSKLEAESRARLWPFVD